MRDGVRSGLVAVAMVVAIAGRGCVTAPPPTAESLVAGAKDPVVRTSGFVAGDDAAGPGAATSAPSVPPASQTAEERRAALDKRLNDSVGAFDAHLHDEQQKTAEERDARQATVAATTAAGAGAENVAAGAA